MAAVYRAENTTTGTELCEATDAPGSRARYPTRPDVQVLP